MKRLKICFVLGSNPSFLGGISLFQKNFIDYLKFKKNDVDITWVYKGKKNRRYSEKKVNYVEIKVPSIYPLDEIIFNKKVSSFLKKNHFDIINSHAVWGSWMTSYKKKKDQKIIHTYHGTSFYFFKNHLERFNLIKKALLIPLLAFSFLVEKPPIKNAESIICVSEHVKEEIVKLYGARKNINVIRTGVDLKNFKKRNKKIILKRLNLNEERFYGIYVGKGGYWTKGLDKVIRLSEKIYALDKNYRLIVIGSDRKKVGHLLNKKFVVFLPNLSRKEIPLYYSISDIFFCLSRYEGGAPTMVTSEAMASRCLIVTDKEARQEIIENEKNGLIINQNYSEEAKRILKIFKNNKKLGNILKNSQRKIKELSFEKWGENYLEKLLK